MRHLKKIQCFSFFVSALILALIPFKTHAVNTSDIVGWRDESHHNAVTHVKVNGVELSKYKPSTYDSASEINKATAEVSSFVSAEITLEDGYTLSSMDDGFMICMSGVQSGHGHITGSTNRASIQLPPNEWHGRDEELYLEFKVQRKQQKNKKMTTINKVVCSQPSSPKVGVKLSKNIL